MAVAGGSSPQTVSDEAQGVESIAAALQLFDLCKPAEGDAVIALSELENVLQQHVGATHDVQAILKPLRGTGGDSTVGGGMVDFLSYWQCMDKFFLEASAGKPSALTRAALNEGSDGKADTIRGMRRFRDGALEIRRAQASDEAISCVELKALLAEIKDHSDDPPYWEEVMEAVPMDGGLSVIEVAEAVVVWLRDVVNDDDGENAGGEELEEATLPDPLDAARGRNSMPGSNRSRSESPRFSLKTELRREGLLGSAPVFGSVTPPITPSPVGGGGSFSFRSSLLPMDTSRGFRGSVIAPGTEINRAQELTEVLTKILEDSANVTAQHALQKLCILQDSISNQLQQQESELKDLRTQNENLESRCHSMEEELRNANELQDDSADQAQLVDDYRRKNENLEQDIAELREHLDVTTQELNLLRLKVEDAERDRAEAKKREWNHTERMDRVQEAEEKAQGQVQWLTKEVEAKIAELEQAVIARKKSEALARDQENKLSALHEELAASKKHRDSLVLTASTSVSDADAEKEVASLQKQLAASKSREEELKLALSSLEQTNKQESATREERRAIEEDFLREKSQLQQELKAAEAREAKLILQESLSKQAVQDAQEQQWRCQDELANSRAREEDLKSKSKLLEDKLADSTNGADVQTNYLRTQVSELEAKVQLQQEQLTKLRSLRDELMAVKEEVPSVAEDEEPRSPRATMVYRQCSYMAEQLKIITRYCQEAERVYDTYPATASGSAPSESRRRHSIQRIQEEGSRVFKELSERLYTLEVQKADADEEIRRLQDKLSELERKLRNTDKANHDLMVELGRSRERERGHLMKQRSSASASASAMSGASSMDGGRGLSLGGVNKAFTATSATSDTHSVGSGQSQGGGRKAGSSSSDPGGFLSGPNRAAADLRTSPKGLLPVPPDDQGPRRSALEFIAQDSQHTKLVKKSDKVRTTRRKDQD